MPEATAQAISCASVAPPACAGERERFSVGPGRVERLAFGEGA
jgi:hypothetical protein